MQYSFQRWRRWKRIRNRSISTLMGEEFNFRHKCLTGILAFRYVPYLDYLFVVIEAFHIDISVSLLPIEKPSGFAHPPHIHIFVYSPHRPRRCLLSSYKSMLENTATKALHHHILWKMGNSEYRLWDKHGKHICWINITLRNCCSFFFVQTMLHLRLKKIMFEHGSQNDLITCDKLPWQWRLKYWLFRRKSVSNKSSELPNQFFS